MVNIMDIYIIDLQGNKYDINSIFTNGNDGLTLVIKKPSEKYITKRKARELGERERIQGYGSTQGYS